MFGEPGRGDRIARRILIPLVVLFVVVTAVFYVAFSQFVVEGDSMEPTLSQGDRVLVTKGYGEPVRGDVVLVRARPHDGGPDQDLIKRIVGIQGDRVRVDRGVAHVNDIIETGAYLTLTDDRDVTTEEIEVPTGHIYLLGDNRPVSYDSRFYGPVASGALKGQVVAVWAPIGRMARVD